MLSESRRLVRADKRRMIAVAPEPAGRKRTALVEPVRECCVSAKGLSEPGEWHVKCNLSGTAGMYIYSSH